MEIIEFLIFFRESVHLIFKRDGSRPSLALLARITVYNSHVTASPSLSRGRTLPTTRDRQHKRETLDNSTEQGEKINSTTTPMVARGRCQEGRFRGGNEGGERVATAEGGGEAESPGSPLTHPDTRAYMRETATLSTAYT